MAGITVTNQTTGTVIGDSVSVATNSWSRFLGLLPKTHLNAGEGLWIRPCSGVHTFFMRFTIDVIALDRDRRVIALWPRLKPWRMTPVSLFGIRSVVELPEGTIERTGVKRGDQLYFGA